LFAVDIWLYAEKSFLNIQMRTHFSLEINVAQFFLEHNASENTLWHIWHFV